MNLFEEFVKDNFKDMPAIFHSHLLIDMAQEYGVMKMRAERCKIDMALKSFANFTKLGNELVSKAVSSQLMGKITADEMFKVIKDINDFTTEAIPEYLAADFVEKCKCVHG